MRGFRFLGRRNGTRRYLIIVTILVVMVMGGIKISYRDDDFRLVGENRIDQNEVVILKDFRKGAENVDVGFVDKVDLDRESQNYDSEDDEYYVDAREHKVEAVPLVPQDDSVDPKQHTKKDQQLQNNPGNEFVVHTFDNKIETNNVLNLQSNQNKPIDNQQFQFGQKQDTENQAKHNPQINQESDHGHKDEEDKAKVVFGFHPESYYDSDDDAVDKVPKEHNNDNTPMPAITKVITFSQYDSEEDTNDAQPDSPNTADKIDNRLVSNLNPEIEGNAEAVKGNLPLIVPNVVHFMWFGNNTMTFNQMLSILSVYHFVKPIYIYYHCDSHPEGEWWQRVISIVFNIKVDVMSPPNEIFGFKILTAKQQADVVKLQTLMTHGGIYIDTDVIVTKSLEPLRSYEFSIGYSQPERFDSDIVISTHTSKFLQKWLVAYTQYSTAASDDYFSCVAPYNLYKQYPNQVHVVNKLSTPTAKNVNSLYSGDLDWTDHYAVHLWSRLHNQVDNLDTVKDLDTPYGKLVRFIYNKV